MGQIEFIAKMQGFVVMDTADKTEGRSVVYPKAVCKVEATAKKLAKGQWVQGSDSPVKETTLYKIKNTWYGPVNIINPSKSDEENQKKLDAKRKARDKLLEAGFTDEDIRLANL